MGERMESYILKDPFLNRGTGFSEEERGRYGLHGLLPYHISTLEEQLSRCHLNYSQKTTPIGKYSYLMDLLSRNESLFYAFLSRYPEEMVPFIYTPTVGEAALQFSRLTWRPRGIYISYPLRHRMEEMIQNIPNEEVDVVVATDGERILGLGDLGIGGMTIPIGKLALYTLFGGIHPKKTLPVFLDVGTNNEELLESPLYLGWRSKRIGQQEYDAFVDSFLSCLFKRFPNVFFQWEDFGRGNARRLLDRYRDRYLSFNDDIQGTASVVLAAIVSALSQEKAKLKDQKIVIFGGGSAGLGIGDALARALKAEGLDAEEAYRKVYILDAKGLLHFNLPRETLTEEQIPFLKQAKDLHKWSLMGDGRYISLLEVVKNVHPTILIGVSAQPGAFTREVVELMASFVKRPIILPLSNPTSRAECTPQDLYSWTQGRAVVATGTPFQPVLYQGKAHQIAQCNNVYFFPGLGLGAVAAKARCVSDRMILEGVAALAEASPFKRDAESPLFPPLSRVWEASRSIALAVARQAVGEGLSPHSLEEVERRVDSLRWNPQKF